MATRDTRKRSRTGCFTCRARRIKCDEAKPSCQRCIRSNIHCDGYEEKRHIEIQRSSLSLLHHQDNHDSNSTAAVEYSNNINSTQSIKRRKRSTASSQCSIITTTMNTVSSPRELGLYPVPSIRTDGLPLVAYPINPHPAQVPQDRARFILAYHQYLFRTLHVLFLPEDFYFWRERLCEQAWETEYVFDAIMALGGMHRAILMMSKPSDNDRNRGEDWQVIAVRSYTRALQELADNMEDAIRNMDLLIGVLILFAYFECYFGNIPAAVRHVYTADHYFLLMRLDETVRGREYMGPIESCLRNLKRVCRIVLPFPAFMVSAEYSSSFDTRDITPSNTSSPRLAGATISSTSLLHSLLDLLSTDAEVEELIWSPIKPYLKSMSADAIKEFQETLEAWRSEFEGLSEYDLEGIGSERYRWSRLQDLSMPPLPMNRPQSTKLSTQMCLVLSVYSFCMGRLLWARSILAGEDEEGHNLEMKAYNYFYQQLQLASMVSPRPEIADDDPFLSCEAANMAIGPMLYVTGHCVPQSTWLRWIIDRLAHIGREGLFNCKAFAQALEVLYSLEAKRSNSPSSIVSSSSYKLSPATHRITSILIPELNGTRFVAFYAGPIWQDADDEKGRGTNQLSHIQRSRRVDMLSYRQGTATWPNSGTIFDSEPRVEINLYDGDGHDGFRGRKNDKELFTTNWLLSQPAVIEWLTWSRHADFDLDRALRDHINGSSLLPDTGKSA